MKVRQGQELRNTIPAASGTLVGNVFQGQQSEANLDKNAPGAKKLPHLKEVEGPACPRISETKPRSRLLAMTASLARNKQSQIGFEKWSLFKTDRPASSHGPNMTSVENEGLRGTPPCGHTGIKTKVSFWISVETAVLLDRLAKEQNPFALSNLRLAGTQTAGTHLTIYKPQVTLDY